MKPLSTWTYYHRHKGHAALLLGLSVVVTIGLYSMVALVWGVFVEPARLSFKRLSEFSIVTPGFDPKSQDLEVVAKLRANPDITKVIPTTIIRIQLPGIIPSESFQFDLLGLMGEDVPYILEKFGATLADGRLPEIKTNELLLSADIANILGVKVGDSYDVISSEFYPNLDAPLEETPFTVAGILESEVELGIVSLEYLDDHVLYSQFPARFLVVAQGNRKAAVDDFLQYEIQTIEIRVMTLDMLNERILNEALPGLLMLLPVVLIVAIGFSLVIVVVNHIANAQRLPEFGILHATGFSKKWLARRLTKETATLAAVGWVVGIGFSWLVLNILKVTYFASSGHDLNYIVWIPIVFAFSVPVSIAGFTFVNVKRTLSHLDPVAIVERRELSQERDQQRERRTFQSSSKPLSPMTFYKRYNKRAVLLISGMSLMILAVVLVIIALAVGADAKMLFLGYLKQVSIVRSSNFFQSLEPEVIARIKTHPAVEMVIPFDRFHIMSLYIPPFTSAEVSPFGVYVEDMTYLVELYNLELKEGHLPRPNSNEMVIPESLAQNRDLQVGDVIGDPLQPAYPGASSLQVEFVISGIFAKPTKSEAENGWGFISLEFLESHEVHDMPDLYPLIVVPKEGQKDTLDDWLETEFAGVDASVLTYHQEVSGLQRKTRQDMLSMGLLESVLAVLAALALAVLNYVFISQRQAEFGVLNALGFTRGRLVKRVFGETTFIIITAWGLSALLALFGMLILRFVIFEPRGLSFGLFNITPWLYTLPIPVIVLAVTSITTARTLSKLDPIAIIERRT